MNNKPPQFYNLDPDNRKLYNLRHIVEQFGAPSCVVEIGCYYGKTTIEFVNNVVHLNPRLHYYAIDPYKDSLDVGEDLEMVYNHITSYLQTYPYKDHITLMRQKSFDGLIELKQQGVRPQLIYIDGDHTASTVLGDLVLSFEILVSGGVIICDDSVDWQYTDNAGRKDPQMSPRLAMETFIACNWQRVQPILLPYSYQTAFKKLY